VVMDCDDLTCSRKCLVGCYTDDSLFRSLEALSMLLASHSKGGRLGFGCVCVSSRLYLVERLAVGAVLHLAQDSRLRREISRDVDRLLQAVFDFALLLVVSAALLAPDVKALLMSIEGFLGPEDSLCLEQRLINDRQPGEQERELLRQCLTLSEAFLNRVVIIDALQAEEPGYRDNPVLSSLLTEPPL
jgi:hypothetical protein